MYEHLKAKPYLIHFKSGLLPQGLRILFFSSTITPTTRYPHFSQGDTHHTFQNLSTFNLPNAYSLSLFDKLSCLEIQTCSTTKTFGCLKYTDLKVKWCRKFTACAISLTFKCQTANAGIILFI